jgi:maleamate amidohydrolase
MLPLHVNVRVTHMDDNIRRALETLFAADSQLYADRSFARRIGFGKRPALLNIDLANAWTQPGFPFTCDGMDTIIPAVQALQAAFRAKGLPVIYTTTAYDLPTGDHPDTGLWHLKIPAETLVSGSDSVAIDERVAPRANEYVVVKKRASAFHGTPLAGYLRANDVDSLVVTGVTASACVRNSVEDAIADGFRPIVVREAVGDRIQGAVEWNLFDIDAKFGDVESLESVLDHLRLNHP